MALLTAQQTADLLNRQDILDTTQYPSAYIAGVLDAVAGAIASYLKWNPALTVYTNEHGVAQYCQSGSFAGRYMVELHNQPLTSDSAASVFALFQLTYPLSLPTSSNVSLDFVKVFPESGLVFCLAPGTVEALSAATFGWAPPMARITAVGYVASYAAGYACGNGTDPNNPLTNAPFVGVDPLPTNIRDAALLLVRERLMVDKAMNLNPTNPNAGLLYRIRVGEREEAYRSFARQNVQGTLGLGTPLSESAEMLLRSSVRRRTPVLI